MPNKEHTLPKFDEVLNAIRENVLSLCHIVDLRFQHALQAFLEADAHAASEVIYSHSSIIQLANHIDELCVKAIALQQPTASDLKVIVIAGKIIVHLESVADEIKKLAEIAERLSIHKRLPKKRYKHVRLAAEATQRQLARAISSYEHTDIAVATELLDLDKKSNEEFGIVFRDLMQSMTDDPRTISFSLEILLAAKTIEQIGNHLQHIAKHIVEASTRYTD